MREDYQDQIDNDIEQSEADMTIGQKVEENDNYKTENDYISAGEAGASLQESSDEANAFKITPAMLAMIAKKPNDC